MLRDYSKSRLYWTKHAASEAIEDGFKAQKIEENLKTVVELPEFNGEKNRGVIKVGERYCTLIYKKMKKGLLAITCWESNPTDVQEYQRVFRQTRRK